MCQKVIVTTSLTSDDCIYSLATKTYIWCHKPTLYTLLQLLGLLISEPLHGDLAFNCGIVSLDETRRGWAPASEAMGIRNRILSLFTFLLLILLSLTENCRSQAIAEPTRWADGSSSGISLPPSDGFHYRRILPRQGSNEATETDDETEKKLINEISEAENDVKGWTIKAEEANTPEKLHKVTEEAKKAANRANDAMRELARLSNDALTSGAQTFNHGWDKLVKVLVDKTGAIMTGYATLLATYEMGLKEDRRQLDDLINKVVNPRTYQAHLNTFRSASAKLGTQVEGALGFLQTKQQLVTKEPDPYWRDKLETEQEAKDRAHLALAEGQKVVQHVYGGMKQQLDNFVGGMVDNFIVINKVRSTVRSHQEEENDTARKAELQVIEQEADEVLEAIKEALWELSPAAPFKEAYDKVSSGEEIGVWGWLTITFEMGLEVLSWVPTPAAPAARAFKVGRTAHKVFKLVKKANRIIEKANKVCGRIDTLVHMEAIIDRLLAGLGKITMIAKSIHGANEKPQAAIPSEDETKSLLELVKMSDMVALPKRGKLSDEDLQAVLKTIHEKLGQGGFIVKAMRNVVCKSMKPVLMASLAGGGKMGCAVGPGTKPFTPSKPNPKPPKPNSERPSPKPKTSFNKLPLGTLNKSLLRGRNTLKREAQQDLAKDFQDFYSRPEGQELDLDLADRILEHAMAEISKLEGNEAPEEDGRPSFLDNPDLLEGLSSLLETSGTTDGLVDEPVYTRLRI